MVGIFSKNVRGFILFALSLLCYSCQQKTGLDLKPETERSQAKLEYGSIIIQEQSEYIIIPVGIPGTVYRGSSYSDPGFHTQSKLNNYNSILATNLIFYNPNHKSSHLLLNKKAIINQFNYLKPKNKNNPPYCCEGAKNIDSEYIPEFLIYQLIESDTNEDGKLNKNDAELVYLSDIDGKNLKQITPVNTKAIAFDFLPSSKIIVFSVWQDSNEDKTFQIKRVKK